MFRIPIKNPTTQRLFLEELMECVDSGEVNALLLDSVAPEVLNLLRHRPTRDVIQAAKLGDFVVHVAFDADAILRCFARLDLIKRDAELKQYFITHGATAEIAADLFKMSADEFRRMRQVLVPAGAPSGRPRLPPEAERERIQEDWARLVKEQAILPKREILFRLHSMHSGWSMQSLWTTLNEFDLLARNGVKWRRARPGHLPLRDRTISGG